MVILELRVELDLELRIRLHRVRVRISLGRVSECLGKAQIHGVNPECGIESLRC